LLPLSTRTIPRARYQFPCSPRTVAARNEAGSNQRFLLVRWISRRRNYRAAGGRSNPLARKRRQIS
jgi:hypothetical protein